MENLLDLDGVRYVIDDALGLWVRFQAKKVPVSRRKQGIKYSLSLHDRYNVRIMGFDNAHEIQYGAKNNVAPLKTFDHWHHDENDAGRPYRYTTAEKLMHDFWIEVDKKLKKILEASK